MKTLLLLTLLIPFPVTACINVDGTALDGSSRLDGGEPHARMLQAVLHRYPAQEAEELLKSGNHNHGDPASGKEHKGVEYILNGYFADAINLFTQLEEQHPGRYSTATNLGTAYELHGDLENALKWIREGIARDEHSHFGTEWLHVEILKTRMKLREDPDYLRLNHVISLPEDYTRSSIIRVSDSDYTVDEIGRALFYQLKERMLFVKPADPVVADLLFTLAHIKSRTATLESAVGILHLSADYGFMNPALLTATTTRFERTILHRQIRKWSLISLGILAGMGLLYVAWRKKVFFLSSKAYRQHRAATA